MSCTHALGGRMFTTHEQVRVGVCAYCGTPLLGHGGPQQAGGGEAVVEWSACSRREALAHMAKLGDAGEPMRLACLKASRDDLDASPPLAASPNHRIVYWQAHRVLDEQIAELERRRRNGSHTARLRVLAALITRQH